MRQAGSSSGPGGRSVPSCAVVPWAAAAATDVAAAETEIRGPGRFRDGLHVFALCPSIGQ